MLAVIYKCEAFLCRHHDGNKCKIEGEVYPVFVIDYNGNAEVKCSGYERLCPVRAIDERHKTQERT